MESLEDALVCFELLFWVVKFPRLDHLRGRFIWACAEGTTYMWSPCFVTKRESWSQSCPNSLIVQIGGVSRAWSAFESSTQHQLWVCELGGTIHTPSWQTPCALGFSEFFNVAVSKLCASRTGPGTVCSKAIKRPPRLLQSTYLLPFSCVHCTSYDPEDLRRVTSPLPCRGGDWGLSFYSIWVVWVNTKG